jgi:DNA-binding transcriptional LysR family regulator
MGMALELAELRSFVVLANYLHFGQAAEALHLSQPALTKQIQRLEAKVAGPLLTRGYRGVTLTPAGEILRDRARNLLREAEIAEQMVRLAVRGKAGLLRIGFGIASLGAGLPDILTRFRQHFPEVQVAMRDMSTPDQIEALEQGEIDVGFVRLPVERPELVTLPVLEEMLVAAIPRGMSYRKGLSSLHDEPFVVISRSVSASFFDHLVQTCRAAGFSPRIVQEVNELFTVLNLVQAGVGVSLVPRSTRLMRVPGVRLLAPGVPEAKWKIGLAWRKLDQSDALVRSFISLARRPRGAKPPGTPRHASPYQKLRAL